MGQAGRDTVNNWGPDTYGDPCRQCLFRWSMSQDEAVELVSGIPAEFSRLLQGVDGRRRHPELEWPVVAYVCHVSDNLGIWAERLAGLALGDVGAVAPYDQDLLAQARRYDDVAMAGALWSLERAAGDWRRAVEMADQVGITLIHPERGENSLLDVVRTNAHDARHHAWDIERTIDGS